MAKEYFGWIGSGGYKNVVMVENGEASVFSIPQQTWVKDNEYLKAKWDPGSDFEEISEAQANEIIGRIRK